MGVRGESVEVEGRCRNQPVGGLDWPHCRGEEEEIPLQVGYVTVRA